MVEQQSTSRRTVWLAALAVVLAAAAFGVAFYLFDGVTLVTELLAGQTSGQPSVTQPPTTPDDKLVLPPGMPEEFALRLWQEQLDSQELIGRLVEGDITRLDISKVTSDTNEATLTVSVTLSDKTKVPGVIGLRKFGDEWYVAFASQRRDGKIARPTSDLPEAEEVDIALLNTILDQQQQSQEVISEYLGGIVTSLTLEDPTPGPNTVTLAVEMQETHGEGYARIVAIKSETAGRPRWFLARFTKTGHDPENL